MSIDAITAYILAIVPAVTALLSIVSSVIILVKKVKSNTNEYSKELKKATDEMNKLYNLYYSVLEQNRQLNESLTDITKQNKRLMNEMALEQDEQQK